MPVSYDKQDHIGIITLSRPEARNAWGDDFNEGIARYFTAMEDDDDIRCVVLTGDEKGGAFSAGANLKNPRTHTLSSTVDFIKSLPKRKDRPFEVLSSFSKPLIGAVNGYAVGIGCIITFCCDLLVASERAEWRLPQVALGIPLKADEAYRIGLAQWLVPHEALMDMALEVAAHIASLPPLATRMTKESLLRGLDIPNLSDASLMDLYRFMALEQTEDKDEGHSAWREKRQPVFRGR